MQTSEREGQGFPAGIPGEFLDHPEEYEEQLPLLKRTLGLVRQYETAKPKGRQTLLDKFGDDIVKNPAHLAGIINNLDLIGEFRSQETVEEIKSRMVLGLEQAVRRSNLRLWTPEKIEELVKLSLDSRGRVKEAYDLVETALFNAPRTVEDAIDVQYNYAWAMVRTTDPDVREEICSILCFEKKVFQPDSFTIYMSICGLNGLTDDIHVQRYVAVGGAIGEITNINELSNGEMVTKTSQRSLFRQSAPNDAFYSLPRDEQVKMDNFREKLMKKFATRFKVFQDTRSVIPQVVIEEKDKPMVSFTSDPDYFTLIEDRKKRDMELESIDWPNNLFYSFRDPLYQYLIQAYDPKAHNAIWENFSLFFLTQGYKKLTEGPIQITDDLELEMIGRGIDSPEQKSAVIRKISDVIQGGVVEDFEKDNLGRLSGVLETARYSRGLMVLDIKGDLDIKFSISQRFSEEETGRLASILQFHRPIISIEQAGNIVDYVSQVRQDIKTSFTRSVGVRGFEHVVSDPSLISFGYRSLSFRLDETKRNIYTTINIMGRDYSFLLDEDYRIVLGDDVKDFRGLQDQTWLELLVLSHLKKIMCTEEADLKNELVGGEKQDAVYRQQTLNRSEHLRRLTSGQKPSADAFGKCLKSDLPVKDLSLINRGRASIGFGGTINTGMWTYVSSVEKVDSQTAKPVKISFATATDDMRKVIPLGEISQEELERIEKEILKDFENL